jgi:hypothetical protein
VPIAERFANFMASYSGDATYDAAPAACVVVAAR